VTSVISAISGHFTRSLLFGTVVPVAVFLVLATALLAPFAPEASDRFQALDGEWQVTSVFVALILATVLLYNLNTPIIRFYEGYPWRYSWLGRWRTWRHRSKCIALMAEQAGMRTLVHALRRSEPRSERLSRLEARLTHVGSLLRSQYPLDPTSVLPTRLGNVIRSFETYAERQYGIASITMWPRLEAVMNEEDAERMDGAKVSFDFMLNISVLATALALVVVSACLMVGTTAELGETAIVAGLLMGIAYLFYRGAIPRAAAWGGHVKATFDLQRWTLLERLGYRIEPRTVAAERALWGEISRRMVFGDPPFGILTDYAGGDSAIQSEPAGLRLRLTRSVKVLGDKTATIEVSILNEDSRRATGPVIVTDMLPAGGLLMTGSATSPRGPIDVQGSNPYRFALPAPEPGQATTFEYRIALLNTK
jgi:hypothetical protein